MFTALKDYINFIFDALKPVVLDVEVDYVKEFLRTISAHVQSIEINVSNKIKGLTDEKAELSTKLNSMYAELEVREKIIASQKSTIDERFNIVLKEKEELNVLILELIKTNKKLVDINVSIVKVLEGYI